jgi:hypothetical protein
VTPTAIFLFDKTGNMAQPWRDAGYRCICFDVQHVGKSVRDGIMLVHWDALLGMPIIPAGCDVRFVFCFPPCTHLAVSGARWFKGKGLRALSQSIEMFATAAEFCESPAANEAPYGIENPVSTISTYWRKPDYTFHPSDYTGFELNDHYSKTTNIWAGNGFIMPKPNLAPELAGIKPDNRIHAAPPSEDRGDIRSATPMGFSRAVQIANGRQLNHEAA